jgi:hypothetical protein
MTNRISYLALVAVLAAGFATPALAQNSNWKLNSDHSTGRLSLSSTADPSETFEVGIARAKGIDVWVSAQDDNLCRMDG